MIIIKDNVYRRSNQSSPQQGKTDYLTFIKMCAETGIEKWKIRMDKMTCTYYDKAGREILEEKIPQ